MPLSFLTTAQTVVLFFTQWYWRIVRNWKNALQMSAVMARLYSLPIRRGKPPTSPAILTKRDTKQLIHQTFLPSPPPIYMNEMPFEEVEHSPLHGQFTVMPPNINNYASEVTKLSLQAAADNKIILTSFNTAFASFDFALPIVNTYTEMPAQYQFSVQRLRRLQSIRDHLQAFE